MNPKFTTEAFILKNTPELRDKLEVLGYKQLSASGTDIMTLETDNGWYYGGGNLANMNPKYYQDAISCGKNEALFLALAALREDSIVGQWHISHCPIQFDRLKGTVETADGKRYVPAGGWFRPLTKRVNFKFMCFRAPDELFHKATHTEIINHFNNGK